MSLVGQRAIRGQAVASLDHGGWPNTEALPEKVDVHLNWTQALVEKAVQGANMAEAGDKEEASVVATLFAEDGETRVGWVYLWNNSELSILWTGKHRRANYIAPPLAEQLMSRTKSEGAREVIEFLQDLKPTRLREP